MSEGYRSRLLVAAATAALILTGSMAGAHEDEEANTFGAAVSGGNFDLAFRYRYEFVDQDGFDKDANASILRTRITYESADFFDFSGLLEIDNLTVIGNDNYNSTRNGKTQYPTVADPKGTAVNQAILRFSGIPDTTVGYGRQRINRDNQRFIGGVGWRQNEQTFDSFTVNNKSLSDTVLDYAYIYNVNRVFGPDAGTPPDHFDSGSHIFNGRYEGLSWATISGYAYFLDLKNSPADSNETYGVRLIGKTEVVEDLFVTYTAEFATQDDYEDNPNDYSADYWMLEGGVAKGGLSAKISYESLEGDADTPMSRFITPLATLHPFQGWADKFLSTPDAGIEDLYVTLGVDIWGPKIRLVYHDFSPQDGGGPDYGSELDLVASQTFAKRYTVLVKYADYDADNFAQDTTKFWVMLSAKF